MNFSRVATILSLMLAACMVAAVPVIAKGGKKASSPPPSDADSYDATRDPAKDLQAAIALATKTHRKILMEVGGDWCVYCNIMDETFASHPGLQKVRDANYVTFKVNYSKENPNQAFLSHYPRIIDYPHFFVLDSKGTLLVSQPTHKFEHGKTYSAGKIEDFLRKSCEPPRRWLTSIG